MPNRPTEQVPGLARFEMQSSANNRKWLLPVRSTHKTGNSLHIILS